MRSRILFHAGAALAFLLVFTVGEARAQTPGFLSEIRAGLYGHDVGVWSNRKEAPSLSGNVELLFVSPGGPFENRFATFFLSPRPHIGAVGTPGDGTSFVYAGLTWQLLRYGRLFAEFGFGGAVHDGNLDKSDLERKALGSRLLFHEQVSVGLELTDKLRVMASFHHISNAETSKYNSGLDEAGVRLGWLF